VFEWDERKAMSNLVKHDISFEEAATVFEDQNAFDARDVAHSTIEARHLLLGMSAAGRLLTICYTSRRKINGEATRIISARPANREEALGYAGTQD
jgi:uncharacterized protein